VLNETAVADFLFCCRVNNEEKQNKANSKYTTVINILLIILYTFKLGICKYFKKIVQLILFRLQALAGSQTHIIKQCEQCWHHDEAFTYALLQQRGHNFAHVTKR